MSAALVDAAGEADIFHSHSLWMMPNIYPGRALKNNQSCKLILSPRGTLSSWAWNRSRWKKRIIWSLGQRTTMERVDCFHATAEEEYNDIRRLGYRQPVAVIPNGVHVPKRIPVAMETSGKRRLLFLARIHPTKGVDILLNAWKAVQEPFPEWELVVGGPDDADGYLREMQRFSEILSLKRVSFPGPVFGDDKSDLFRSADVYVFCLLHEKDKDVIDPLNLSHWTFYVVPRIVLDEQLGDQESMGLSTLLNLSPAGVPFAQLRNAVRHAAKSGAARSSLAKGGSRRSNLSRLGEAPNDS